MNEDNLLKRLGEIAREEQKDDAAFERVARGTADADELLALERAASGDPEIAIRLEGSRPIEAPVVEAMALRLHADRSSGAVAPKTAEVVTLASRRASQASWKRRAVTIAGPLALAAGMILYVATQTGPTGPELPSYTVTAVGEQAMRGPSETSPRLRLVSASRAARFEIVLRPAAASQEKVVAYAFTFGSEGEAVPLDAKIEIAPEGSVRIAGAARELGGSREIRIVVGAPGAIGKFDDAAARAKRNTSDAHVRVVVVPIDRD